MLDDGPRFHYIPVDHKGQYKGMAMNSTCGFGGTGGWIELTVYSHGLFLWAYLRLAGHSLSSFEFSGILFATH